MFSSLTQKNYRIYWYGMFVSLIGTWIQTMAQSWLVFDLTKSSFLLGLVGFLSSIPVFMLALFGGVIADRVNKKSILIVTQNAFMVLAFILAILTQLKIITVWQIMLIALFNGVVMSFDAPTRQAMVVELVGKKYLMNAIAINSLAFNSSRIIGPALAGILVASIGISSCFYLNAISFVAVIIALFFIRTESLSKKNNSETILEDLLEGLVFIRNNRLITILVSIVGVFSLFGVSYVIIMPVFAQSVLNSGVKGFAILMSATGIGAMLGALMLAALSGLKHKGRLLFITSLVFSISLILLSISKNLIVSVLVLVLVGWGSVSATALVNTMLQTLVPDHVRGRVMSVFMFTFAGILPFGNLIAGTLAQMFGVSLALFVGGCVCTLFTIGVNFFNKELRAI